MTTVTKTVISSPFEIADLTYTSLSAVTATEECKVDMSDCGDILTLVINVPSTATTGDTLTVTAGDYINKKSFTYTLTADKTELISLESALVKQDNGYVEFTFDTDNTEGIGDEGITVAAVVRRYVTAH